MLNQLSADRGERERLQRMFEQAPGFMALLEGPDHRFTVANRAFHDLVGGRDLVGRAVANAIPEFAGQGFIEILDEISQSSEPFVGHSMPLRISDFILSNNAAAPVVRPRAAVNGSAHPPKGTNGLAQHERRATDA